MVYTNSKPFIRTFKLIRKIVGGVDYKVSMVSVKQCVTMNESLSVYYTSLAKDTYSLVYPTWSLDNFKLGISVKCCS